MCWACRVEDVGAAIALAAMNERAARRVYNVAGWKGQVVTVPDGTLSGPGAPCISGSTASPTHGASARDWVIARRCLAWRPCTARSSGSVRRIRPKDSPWTTRPRTGHSLRLPLLPVTLCSLILHCPRSSLTAARIISSEGSPPG